MHWLHSYISVRCMDHVLYSVHKLCMKNNRWTWRNQIMAIVLLVQRSFLWSILDNLFQKLNIWSQQMKNTLTLNILVQRHRHKTTCIKQFDLPVFEGIRVHFSLSDLTDTYAALQPSFVKEGMDLCFLEMMRMDMWWVICSSCVIHKQEEKPDFIHSWYWWQIESIWSHVGHSLLGRINGLIWFLCNNFFIVHSNPWWFSYKKGQMLCFKRKKKLNNSSNSFHIIP